MYKRIIAIGSLVLLLIACSKVPITGRKQLNLLSESDMVQMSAQAYDDFLSENDPLPDYNEDAQRVRNVGERISVAVEEYLNNHGYHHMTSNFNWKFNTVDDPTVNAWCMPGGKVVFYTGILPICQDDAGIAVVMGHEIAHAVAKHGNERMSQAIGIQAAGMTLDVLMQEQPQQTRELLLESYGIGAGVGSLAFSRSHETEADKMGLVFMAMASYDPRNAPEFWKRMSEVGGEKPPEILSTHPSDERRINDLNQYMDEALKYYKP